MNVHCIGSSRVDECSLLGAHDGMGLTPGHLLVSDIVDGFSPLIAHDEIAHGC